MKKILVTLTIAAFASISAHAQIINVEISNAGGTAYAGTGADLLDTTGTTWNIVTANGYSSGNLTTTGSQAITKDQSGTTLTGYSLTVTDQGNFSEGASSNLFNNGSSSYSNTIPTGASYVTINTGLDNQLFSLYVYSSEGPNTTGNPATFGLVAANGGATATTTNTVAENGNFVLGQNYQVLTGITSATGVITLDYNRALTGASGSHGDLNGFQLDFVAATIPEPSTYALMAAGLGALVFFARRRLIA